jgi:hypothetical protein
MEYGKHITADTDHLEEFLSTVDYLDSFSTRLCYRGTYLANLGIIDFKDPNYSPLDLVRMHPQENASEFSALYDKWTRYLDLDMFKETGIPIDRFFEMPREFVDLTFRIVSKKAARANSAVDVETAKINAELEKAKQSRQQ